MILTKLYRLQKKKGAVLFVVIAMMTLLVIMATTAYMTARSSYKTVINNYDFSQLYLSAVSISDMMVGAVTNDTVDVGTGAKNNFSELKEAVLDLSLGETLKAKSSNITSDMDSVEKILSGTANNPVESGVLDAVEVSIQKESSKSKDKITGDPDDKGITYDYYLFTTTAYYRSNTVSIQDRIIRESGEKSNTLFDTFFTATGKKLNGDQAEDDASRCAVIDTHDISDDSFFENEYTVFKDATTMNTFHGGITSAGSVWLEQFQCDISDPTGTVPPESEWGTEDENGKKKHTKVPGTRNDWFIGGSLVFGGNAQSWDIGNNNLYVDGDLILTKNMNTFKAKNIYVTGNVIDLSGSASSSANANFYVGGTVLTNLNLETLSARELADEGTLSPPLSAAEKAEKERKLRHNAMKQNALDTMSNINNACKSTLTAAGSSSVGNLSGYGSTGGATSGLNISGNLYVNNTTDLAPQFLAQVDGSWDANGIIVPVGYQEPDSSQYNKYVNYSKNVEQAVSGETDRNDYLSYSASSDTMANTLTIDFSQTTLQAVKDKNGNPTGEYTGDFYINGNTSQPKATVYINSSGNGSAKVTLPYVEKGYVLDLRFDNSPNHKAIEYTIDSGISNETVLPIVLKANFDDGLGQAGDSDGDNSFAWNVDGSGNRIDGDSSSFAKVQISGAGDVFFELGNYNSSGDYKSFKAGTGLNTATYYTTEFSQIGTVNQLGTVSAANKDKAALENLLQSGTSNPQTNYDNQVMIISNKSGGVAYNNNRMNATCFGYLYAPFSDYSNWNTSKSAPFFGGMIVSNYSIQQSEYVYAEPDPQLIKNLETALPEKDDLSDEEEDKWYTNDSALGAGSNFLG